MFYIVAIPIYRYELEGSPLFFLPFVSFFPLCLLSIIEWPVTRALGYEEKEEEGGKRRKKEEEKRGGRGVAVIHRSAEIFLY